MKLFACAVALYALSLSAQAVPKGQLGVRLTSDSASYSLRGNLRFEVVRENTGSDSVVIYRRWEWVAFSKIRVFDSKGSEIKDQWWPIDDPPPLTSADFIMLKSGESLGTVLTMSVEQLVKSPGDYEFFVEYKSYLSDEVARKYIPSRDVPFWSRNRNTLTSNRIKLRIME
jgi:hypothetical protein